MGDPIWLDTNTIINVVRGDHVLEAELTQLRKQGHQLLIVPAVQNELLNGNPLTMSGNKSVHAQAVGPKTRAETQMALNRLGVQVDMEAAKLGNGQKIPTAGGKIDVGQSKRVGYAIQDHVKRPKNVAMSPRLSNISESDSLVLSQIKASAEARGVKKPKMFTIETGNKAMVTQAYLYDVETISPKSPPPNSGTGSARMPPVIDIADYPADQDGVISRFFKDRPVLEQAGLMGFSVLASMALPKALEKVEDHYNKAIEDARKEFNRRFPDARSLSRDARLEQYRQSYEVALGKMKAPSNVKTLAYTMVALGPTKDTQSNLEYVKKQLTTVKLADGTMGGYGDAADAYVNAMVDLYGQLTKYQIGIADIVIDVQSRASVLTGYGQTLMADFYSYVPFAASSPLSYYPWLDVYTVATTILKLGANLQNLATEISDRQSGYENLSKSLDAELIKVSEQMAKFAP
ncbi:MAG TPA: hypothetical protein VHZ07_02435 [Bryobacteraceae bacterium]|jgi:hypothetical protein|nr:hypothetical protein [Bryobacteraceae bacterium]